MNCHHVSIKSPELTADKFPFWNSDNETNHIEFKVLRQKKITTKMGAWAGDAA